MLGKKMYWFAFGVVAVLLVEWWQLCQVQRITQFNTWMAEVYYVSQPGVSEKQVLERLGIPIDISYRPHDVIGITTPVVPFPDQAYKAYRYARLFPGKGIWNAYVFIDNSGKVVGSYVSTYLTSVDLHRGSS